MLSIVLGAGVLILPGLAVREAGELAFLSWVVCAAAALPLLGLFVVLGRRYPNAGGLAHFAGQAFGRPGYLIGSFIFLGAVLFGLPAIALTGGHYAAGLTGVSPHLLAIALLALAALTNVISAEVAGRIGAMVGIAVAGLLACIAVLTIFGTDGGSGAGEVVLQPRSGGALLLFAPFMMIFFAFTGWEVAANLSEEFRRPSRDFPLAMIGSFCVATALYLVLAYAAQGADLAGSYEAPFARIFADRFGPAGGAAIAAAAVFIIYANLSAAIWAVSRLVFSLAREGVLPSALQQTRSGTPRAAVQCTAAALVTMVAAEAAGFVPLHMMLALAGQNFLLLYGIAAAALLMMSRRLGERFLAMFSGGLVVALCAIASGSELLYPAGLAVLALAVWQRGRQRQSHSAIPAAAPGAPAE